MPETTALRLPQDRDTTLTVVQRARFAYRYAYVRSHDTEAHDANGQDYLVIFEDGERLAFVLCDGVGQSFCGDLAARFLGEVLVEWLWSYPLASTDTVTVQEALAQLLLGLTEQGSEQVRSIIVPASVAPMVREVLEQKRDQGSESTIAAGVLDFAADCLALVWMGDSRIRLWGPHGERTSELGHTFNTRERWSSRLGPVGQAHGFSTPLSELVRIVAYSDGLARLDAGLEQPLTDSLLNEIIAGTHEFPNKDDISFLEVYLGGSHEKLDLPWPPLPVYVEANEGAQESPEYTHASDEVASLPALQESLTESLPMQSPQPDFPSAPISTITSDAGTSSKRRSGLLVLAVVALIMGLALALELFWLMSAEPVPFVPAIVVPNATMAAATETVTVMVAVTGTSAAPRVPRATTIIQVTVLPTGTALQLGLPRPSGGPTSPPAQAPEPSPRPMPRPKLTPTSALNDYNER